MRDDCRPFLEIGSRDRRQDRLPELGESGEFRARSMSCSGGTFSAAKMLIQIRKMNVSRTGD